MDITNAIMDKELGRSAFTVERLTYTEPEISPQPARSADVIYWSLSPEEGSDPASYNETAASSGSHKPTVHRFLAYQLLVVCYGSSCEANARKIRSFFMLGRASERFRSSAPLSLTPLPSWARRWAWSFRTRHPHSPSATRRLTGSNRLR